MKRVFALRVFMPVLLLIFSSITVYSQVIDYYDNFYGHIASSNARVVTTIKEFTDNDEVHIEAVVIGYLYMGTISVNLHYDSDVVFPIKGPGGDEITQRLNGQSNMGYYLSLNPSLPNPTLWRTTTTGNINPTPTNSWTNVMAGGIYLFSEKKVADGEMLSIFKLYFKKREGKALSNTTFTYYDKNTRPYCYNEFTLGTAVILSGEPRRNLYVNPEMFVRRSPSKIETGNVIVNGTSVTLTGIASAEGLDRVPGEKGLDWDNILSTGFIYSKNAVSLKINEYSQKIILNDMEYDFPTVSNGSFTLNGFTFNIVTTENTQGFTKINMQKTLKNLEAGETYYAYPFMTYHFQTSQPYPVLGEPRIFIPDNCTPHTVLMQTGAVAEICEGNVITKEFLQSLIEQEVGYDYLFYEDAGCSVLYTTDIIADYSANSSPTFYVKAKDIEAGCTTDLEDVLALTLSVNPVLEILTTSERELYLEENAEFNLFVEAKHAESYQWYFNGVIIEGATQFSYSDIFNFAKEGVYTVSISNGCGTLEVSFEVYKLLGIITTGEDEVYRISVYPNPIRRDSKLFILLELPSKEQPEATAQLFNIEGKRVAEYQLTDYKTEIKQKMAEGTYFLRVKTKSGKELVTKVLVQ